MSANDPGLYLSAGLSQRAQLAHSRSLRAERHWLRIRRVTGGTTRSSTRATLPVSESTAGLVSRPFAEP